MMEIAFDQNNDGMISEEEANFYLSGKDYYTDGQNTQLTFFEKKKSTGGGKKAPQITHRGWIFWTMIFYNLKKFTSRSI